MINLNSLRIKYFILFQIFCSIYLSANIEKRASPGWVEYIQFDSQKTLQSKSGFEYLLVDLQTNVELQQAYSHFAIHLSSPQSVQDFSTIEINYDPTFQTLWIHEIRVFRKNKYIDKYIPGSFLALASTDRDVHIFDGSITATNHLEDILPGDILEYSYTIVGFQPAMSGKFERNHSLQYGIPLEKLSIKLLYNSSRKLDFKIFNKISQVKQQQSSSGKYQTMKWYGEQIPALIADQNIPPWFNPYARVEISEWQSWEEVSIWGQGLYNLTDKELQAVMKEQENLTKGLDSMAAIVKLAKFVQNEIRYLGLEQGAFSFTPRPPSTILSTKRGDCKEKSLLLIALLKNYGVDAFPILVNTTIGKILETALPGPFNFDHCIVGVYFKGIQYFVDPVISEQTLPLTQQPTSGFHFALPLKKGQKSLMSMPEPSLIVRKIFDTYTFSEKESDATFEVYSIYRGYDADINRKYYNDNSPEVNTKNYLSYYSIKYPGIFESAPHKDEMTDSDSVNEYSIFEYYGIADLWQQEKEDGQLFCSFEPFQLSYLIDISDKSKRTMPWNLSGGLELHYNILLQSDVGIINPDHKLEIKNDFFHYVSEIIYTSATIKLEYFLKFTADHVPPEHFNEFLADIQKVNNDLNFTITLGSSQLAANSSFDFGVFFLLIVCIILTFILIRKFYFFDPDPILKNHGSWNISSWLIILPLAIILGIFVQIVDIVETYLPFITSNTLSLTVNSIASGNQITYFILLVFEFFVNIFLLGMSILLLILILKRRSSFPHLFSAFQIIKLVAVVTIHLLLSSITYIDGTQPEAFTTNEIMKFFFHLLWIPVILTSERSKNTFVTRLQPNPEWEDVNEQIENPDPQADENPTVL